MAGDWIQMRTDLADDPAVIAMSAALGIDADWVVGKLHGIWSWANTHTKDGYASVTLEWLDVRARCANFGAAMRAVGWLEVTEDGRVLFPKYSRYNGKSAKKRALSRDRMKRYRSLSSVTQASPEKRREEKRITDPPSEDLTPKPPSGQVAFPKELDTPECRQALTRWLQHKRSIGKPYKGQQAVQQLLNNWRRSGPAAFIEAVDHSIGQNYQGLFPPNPKSNAQRPPGPGQQFTPGSSRGPTVGGL